ncbi:MAG: protein-L-isoaspartate(D-aspartate) O-methyltransferase [Bacteroidetes bacterium]|nr:protein-L-isoaspartate(D-aspartate) O-methyltransferase [Bacteroidota bacterium]
MIWNNSGAQQSGGETSETYTRQRTQMVKEQIIRRGISDPNVIRAMMTVPRHLFVDEEDRNEAYEDHPIGIGEGQTISQPYIVAFMTEVLKPDSTMRVLEIGTGSGYQAAILAELCDSVFTIEVFESLGEKAKRLFSSMEYHNIQVKVGDGYLGWAEKAPFDAIIVTCAPTHIPEPLKKELKEGARMIIPVGNFYNQELILLEKKEGKLIRQNVLPVRFVPMIDTKGNKY